MDAEQEYCMNESFAPGADGELIDGIYRVSLVWAENCINAKERSISMTVIARS
jgi:hypothetical protein